MHIKTSDQEKLKLGIGEYSCNFGVHIAVLYETEEERDEIINGFLAEGLKIGDLQLYCPTDQSIEDCKQKIAHYCPECESKLGKSNNIAFFPEKDVYYPDGSFSPDNMEDILNKLFIETQKNGKRNIRAVAEMDWAHKAIPGVEDVMVYESKLNHFISNKPWASICLYNTTKFSGSIIMNVLKTHPYTISGGILMQNPFYEDPDTWLAKNAPEFSINEDA